MQQIFIAIGIIVAILFALYLMCSGQKLTTDGYGLSRPGRSGGTGLMILLYIIVGIIGASYFDLIKF